jgi:hypothetical protein
MRMRVELPTVKNMVHCYRMGPKTEFSIFVIYMIYLCLYCIRLFEALSGPRVSSDLFMDSELLALSKRFLSKLTGTLS